MFIMEWCPLVIVVVGSLWVVGVSRSVEGPPSLTRGASLRTTGACGQPSEPITLSDDDAVSVGKRSVTKRVVGGSPTSTKSFPWTVMIKRYGHSDVVCSGATISSRLVLTAAHCFDDVHLTEVYLWVGKDQLDYHSPHQHVHFLDRVLIHQNYNRSTKRNDIAILTTATDIHFNSNVQPICLPDSVASFNAALFASSPGQRCVLAGYGDTQGTGHERRLNFMEVPLVPDWQCVRTDWLGTNFQAVEGVSFCAGYEDGGPDACSGDSGAALVCPHPLHNYYYVHGLSSWGKGCGERKKPGVYTRVSSFLDWINTAITAPLPLRH